MSSIHSEALRERGFSQVPSAPHCSSVTKDFMDENPEAGPFFYRATIDESAATIAIDECTVPWIASGTVDLTDLGFTQCPVPY